jgi:signal transduction histidine kinase
VARFDFGQEAAIRRLGVGLLVGFVVVLLLMLTMLWASSRRVLRPLETLTHAVATLDTGQIASVIAVPPNADSETARLAETINASLLRIDRSFEEVRRFTADAAHELLTPIAILKGHIEVALRRERSANDYKDTLRTLIEEVDSMAGLVRALLTLARLDESVGTDEPAGLVDIDAVLSDEVAAVRSSASARGVRVDLSAVSGEVSGEVSGNRVIGHPQLIREAVRNILDNAIKYTENGTVGIHAVRNNGRVTISVDDTGRGIRTDELPMLTERFFRARDVQDLPGHGLGLALVSAIAKRHGGRLSIAQRKEGGTHVELSLPASVEPVS